MLSNPKHETDIEREVGTGEDAFWSRRLSSSRSQQVAHSTGGTDDILMNAPLMNLGGRLRQHPQVHKSP